jgi:predicted GH43/DUF377 family glycosyl hydrolase
MRREAVRWASDNVFNPAAVLRDGKVCLLFRAEDGSGTGIGEHTSRIGLAESSDGLHFSVRPEPVVFPADDTAKPFEWPGGCEDPRVVEGGPGYVMTYTGWNRLVARLEVATSPDLIHWTKHGPAFGGPFRNEWSKSGAIVTQRTGDHLRAARMGGRYWMYWGDSTIRAATSTDLIHWTPVVDASGKARPVILPRPGTFDSGLAESGPPALLTKSGIVLIYNGKSEGGAYSAGQVLLDAHEPTRVLERTGVPFLRPERPYERSGQYGAGTVFTEGLVHFKGKWLLYFGAADSAIGCARAKS